MTYEVEKQPGRVLSYAKTIFVAALSFFGAAFTIMTFNNDVDIPKLFAQIYQQFTGTPSSGFTVMEFSYSIGLGLGYCSFSNLSAAERSRQIRHLWKWRCVLTEDEIDTTLIERSTRDPKKQKNTNQQKKAGG